MKNRFPGYYRPTDEELDVLWNEGTLVLDTNILLDLYRVPEETRSKILDMLMAWKGRVWIPHQVGVEFHGMRISTINSVYKKSTSVGTDLLSKFEAFRQAVDEMKLAERGCSGASEMLEEMQTVLRAFSEKAVSALSGAISPTDYDPVLPKIDELLQGSVGDPPAKQEELDAIYKEGATRYVYKVGPGFEDAKKANESKPKYMVGGLVYERQYSDLVLWKQTIKHAKATGIKKLVFLTKDAKKDWWHIIGADTRVAPLPEMCQEMMLDGGVDMFWIYTLSDALIRYGEKGNVQVDQAIQDVQNADDLRAEALVDGTLPSAGYEAIQNWISSFGDNKLAKAAHVLELQVFQQTVNVVCGRSMKSSTYGAIVTTNTILELRPLALAEDVVTCSNALRTQFSVKHVNLIVLIPSGLPEEELAAVQTKALRFSDLLQLHLDILLIGHIAGASFTSVRKFDLPSDLRD